MRHLPSHHWDSFTLNSCHWPRLTLSSCQLGPHHMRLWRLESRQSSCQEDTGQKDFAGFGPKTPMASVSCPPVLIKKYMKMKNTSCSHVDHFPLPAKLCPSSPSTMPRPSHTLVISFSNSLTLHILSSSNSCWIVQLYLKSYPLNRYMVKSLYTSCLRSPGPGATAYTVIAWKCWGDGHFTS